MKHSSEINHIDHISDLMEMLGQPSPQHPMIALVDYDRIPSQVLQKGIRISLDFYKVSFKKTFSGQVKYGQDYYDFKEGGMAFLKPRQVVVSPFDEESYAGQVLYFHPDFIRNFPLGNKIHQYGFFSYAVAEALHLSAKEKEVISGIFQSIASEIENNIDHYSQDILVSQIELLLNYSNRFYNRQFITRKTVNHEMIHTLDQILTEYFTEETGLQKGLVSVHQVSERLQLSQRYLSDMLRTLTGMNTQQYIQNKMVEHSKDLLSTTNFSVAEIAYHLGFEHPQSFSKLFKSKTRMTPREFRHSFE